MADAEAGAAPGAAPAAAPDDARPGETRAQASARLRREKREAARKKREKKMREAEYHGKEEEPATVAEEKRATGAWADDGCMLARRTKTSNQRRRQCAKVHWVLRER